MNLLTERSRAKGVPPPAMVCLVLPIMKCLPPPSEAGAAVALLQV